MIKVLHLITKLEFGGAQQNTLHTVTHLDRTGFEPVLASGAGGYFDSKAENFRSTCPTFWLKHLIREIRPLSDLLAFIEIFLLIRRLKPHIIHTHSSKAGILGRWAAYFAGTPVIIHTFHGFGFHDRQKRPLRNFLIWIEKITAKITTALVYVSKENIRIAKEHCIPGKAEQVLIRSGIDIAKYKKSESRDTIRERLGFNSTRKIAVTIGNLKKQKNPKDFFNIAQALKSKLPDALFLFVGGDDKNNILGDIPENSRHLGWREDTADLLKAADIFVLTSLWEGLPRSVLEALCAGIPVCAYATDGVKEVVIHGQNGFISDCADLKSITKHVSDILSDTQLRDKMSKCAASSIDAEFDINKMVKDQEVLYKRLFL
ncbi:glycosyltransferase family 4 protein [Elusimicrobiota bacterium]